MDRRLGSILRSHRDAEGITTIFSICGPKIVGPVQHFWVFVLFGLIDLSDHLGRSCQDRYSHLVEYRSTLSYLRERLLTTVMLRFGTSGESIKVRT